LPDTLFERWIHRVTEQQPLSIPQYERLAAELQTMSDMIRMRPEMNHHFAERLAELAKEMREDEARAYPAVKSG
jgi:hypothetical protein